MDMVGGSAVGTPYSSYNPSPCASYNPSPGSSSFPSPCSSFNAANPNSADGNSLIPWLKNLSSGSSSSSKFPHLYMHSGSISAPVTPPLSSPTAKTPRLKANWDDQFNSNRPSWLGQQQYSFIPSSTPPSPGHQVLDPDWFAGIRIPQGGPASPTFSLVASNPFGFKEEVFVGSTSGSHMWTPGQSGTCSPAVAASSDHTADIPMTDAVSDEFAFGSSTAGLVKPWKGERIHEEIVSDDLELTLGNSKTRSSLHIAPPDSASCCWRSIFKACEVLRTGVDFCLGDGHSWFWYDEWSALQLHDRRELIPIGMISLHGGSGLDRATHSCHLTLLKALAMWTPGQNGVMLSGYCSWL
ncbi:hypothetical protein TanjilG_03688 [Lupinus angustifolius]|uniref:Protein BZR1 homolog n=1 Tax=Lupinus angustifolius TaxID=3871 RepID=A0A1J7HXN2_LUPAN|nr:hypothetical protein TanjilG_03688 [Lupinus angustifolius]